MIGINFGWFLLVLFALCASSVFAGGKPPPPPTTSMAQADSVSASNSAANATSESISDSHSVSGATSTSGDSVSKAEAIAGPSSSQSTSKSGASSATLNNVTPDKIRIQNNASIVLGSPDVSGGICIVSFSGAVSGKQGAIAIFPYRRDPACMAERRFERLAALGLFEAASKAYCDTTWRGGFLWIGKRGYWTDFDSIEHCEVSMVAGLEASVVTDSIVVMIDVDANEPQTCVTTGTNVQIEIEGKLYDCGELKGKMSGREYE